MIRDGEIRGVVFDLDGLMIESEPIGLRIWRDYLAQYGKELSDEDYRRVIGMETRDSVAFIRERTGLPLEVDMIREDRWRMLSQAIREEARPKDGLIELIDTFRARGLPLAVASNSPSGYVDTALTTIGMRGAFHCVIASDHVARGKPAPDVYLAAAESLRCPPKSCLAIEDSPIGLQSAISAGMRCIVVPNRVFDRTDFHGAYGVYDSLHMVNEGIDALLDGAKSRSSI